MMKPDVYRDYERIAKDAKMQERCARDLRNRRVRDGVVSGAIELFQLTAVYWFIETAQQHQQGVIACGIVFFYALLALGGLCREDRLLDLAGVLARQEVEGDKQAEQIERLVLRELEGVKKCETLGMGISTASKFLMLGYTAFVFLRM